MGWSGVGCVFSFSFPNDSCPSSLIKNTSQTDPGLVWWDSDRALKVEDAEHDVWDLNPIDVEWGPVHGGEPFS